MQDVLYVVFKLLKTKDLIAARRTCKLWNSVYKKYLHTFVFDLSKYYNITDAGREMLRTNGAIIKN